MLDTGSTNVFLLGTECKTETCNGHNLYDHKNAVNKWNTKIDEIGYISGSSKGKFIYFILFYFLLQVSFLIYLFLFLY